MTLYSTHNLSSCLLFSAILYLAVGVTYFQWLDKKSPRTEGVYTQRFPLFLRDEHLGRNVNSSELSIFSELSEGSDEPSLVPFELGDGYHNLTTLLASSLFSCPVVDTHASPFFRVASTKSIWLSVPGTLFIVTQTEQISGWSIDVSLWVSIFSFMVTCLLCLEASFHAYYALHQDFMRFSIYVNIFQLLAGMRKIFLFLGTFPLVTFLCGIQNDIGTFCWLTWGLVNHLLLLFQSLTPFILLSPENQTRESAKVALSSVQYDLSLFLCSLSELARNAALICQAYNWGRFIDFGTSFPGVSSGIRFDVSVFVVTFIAMVMVLHLSYNLYILRYLFYWTSDAASFLKRLNSGLNILGFNIMLETITYTTFFFCILSRFPVASEVIC